MLRELGAEVIEMPAIYTQKRDCAREFLDILPQIREYRYMVFTSPSGVDYFFELLENLDLDIRCIGDIRLAVIGSATKDALRKHGLKPALMPARYNGAALGKLLNQSLQDGEKVLLLRSAMGSRELVKEIQSGKQIQVTDLAIYDTIYTADEGCLQESSDWQKAASGNRDDSDWQKAASGNCRTDDCQADMVMFTSASAVRGFVQMAQGADYAKIHAVCIGRMTADQAAYYGMQVHLAEQETVESMTQAALQLHLKMVQNNEI